MITEHTGQNYAPKPGSAEQSAHFHSSQLLSFETLLEDICERLQDTKQQNSLKRLSKLEETLAELDQELEELEKAVSVHMNRGLG